MVDIVIQEILYVWICMKKHIEHCMFWYSDVQTTGQDGEYVFSGVYKR
ncbi:MAG TPA: hypothetical protein PKY89_07745 [Deltaproteobacteria bacterium]|nr:hypothetical protein [Deltaproteobacteria bacterium]